MEYFVYTDGACSMKPNEKLGKMSMGYLIRTKDQFITLDLCSFKKPGLARVAEALAIYKAIDDLLTNTPLTKKDYVRIYTDCLPILKVYKNAGKRGVKKPFFHDPREVQTWNILCKLRRTCSWNFVWIPAHKNCVINGNKVADRLAKYALQFM